MERENREGWGEREREPREVGRENVVSHTFSTRSRTQRAQVQLMELTRVVGEKEKIARDVMNAMAPGRLQWLLQCVCPERNVG